MSLSCSVTERVKWLRAREALCGVPRKATATVAWGEQEEVMAWRQ